jgi:NitT/TauT family transport system ATP-binding protein
LTADNLRNDLMDLWQERKTKIKSILLVTHNIDEAVMMADRIMVFGSDPGTVKRIIDVPLPQPRDNQSKSFLAVVDQVYAAMTSAADHNTRVGHFKAIDMGYRLPKVTVSEMSGFMDSLLEHDGPVNLSELSEELHLNVDDLFPVTEALEILRFASIKDNDIALTDAGRMFIESDILQRKQVFCAHLVSHVPLARHIRRVLDERPGHRAKEERFLNELEDSLSSEAAEEVLAVVIDWGRYAEVFAYDYNTGILSLENPV